MKTLGHVHTGGGYYSGDQFSVQAGWGCSQAVKERILITGANSLSSLTTLAARGGRSWNSRAGFLLGRSWPFEARLRFFSTLSEGMVLY